MLYVCIYIGAVTGRFNSSDEDIPLDLIFFSPFERSGHSTPLCQVFFPQPL